MASAADAPGELFTRGSLDAPDTRGQSMVAKHLDKLQKEKEARAMAKLQALMPKLSPALRELALQECDWSEEHALSMLRRFQVDKSVELTILQKERKRHEDEKIKEASKSKSKSKKRSGHNSDSEAGSPSSSSSDSDNSSDSDDTSSDTNSSDSDVSGRRKRKRSVSPSQRKSSKSSKRDKKDKKRKRSSSSRKDSKKDKKKQKKKRSKKESKWDKDKAKAKKPASADQDWGKYGLIRETDMYAKRPEFMLWAMEVKKADIEAMPKFEEKELFRSYMEDFNTGTLPHRKYYDQEAYEKLKAAKAAKRGGPSQSEERALFNDEEERKRELAAQRAQQQQDRLKQAYNELLTTGKAADMREQELMRAKMSLAYRTGNQKEAMRLAERLKPDEK